MIWNQSFEEADVLTVARLFEGFHSGLPQNDVSTRWDFTRLIDFYVGSFELGPAFT